MPGICGIVSSGASEELAPRLKRMVEAMRHQPWYVSGEAVDETSGVALGCASLGFLGASPRPASSPDSMVRVILDGEIYNAETCRRALRSAGAVFESDRGAELLLHGYLLEGRAFPRRLEGKFSAAIWDQRHPRLVLLNDKFGMKPLYHGLVRGEFLFGSEIKALAMGNPELLSRQSHRGLVQFLTFGHFLNDDTLFEAVHALPPAAWVTHDAAGHGTSVERYWTLAPVSSTGMIGAGNIQDQIGQQLKESVESKTKGTPKLGLALSGGLDARTILGLVDQSDTELKCVSLGMPGSMDLRAARELSVLAGFSFHPYVLNERFLDDFAKHLERMVMLTDGHYLSQCIVMPTLPFYRELEIEVLLRGHAGELLHMSKAYNFSLDREALLIQTADAMETWLMNHLSTHMLDAVNERFFTFADPREAAEIALGSLRQSLAESADWISPMNRISQLFISQRLRRETAMSLVKFGSAVETRLPYLHSELVETLLAAPPELRLSDETQIRILRNYRPDLLGPRNSNTGARLGASRSEVRLSCWKTRVLAKLRVPGYQPYERLGLWLRRELRPLVDAILLDDRCLQRGMWMPDAVRRIVADHAAKRRNHTYLILAMLIHEIGQRGFVDRDGADLASRLEPHPTLTTRD